VAVVADLSAPRADAGGEVTPAMLSLRLMSAGEACARRDAALIARIQRRVGRADWYETDEEESNARFDRNWRARVAARRHVRLWKWQHGQEA